MLCTHEGTGRAPLFPLKAPKQVAGWWVAHHPPRDMSEGKGTESVEALVTEPDPSSPQSL